MSKPFIDKIFTFTQPDGTKFQVRGTGNQHYAKFETLDGYSLVKNPNSGYFEIAQLSDDGTRLESAPGPQGNLDGSTSGLPPGVHIDRDAARARGMEGPLKVGERRCEKRRMERKSMNRAARSVGGPAMAPPQRATIGDFVGLCLLIDFSDEPGTISRNEVERFCNHPGYSGFGNNGSVSDYFRDNSIGRCNYTNIVTNYYRAQHPKSHYTNPNIPQGTRARQLIVEALSHLQAANFDFSQLTADGGGFVYAMNVYYAGEVVNNWGEGLWPHAWNLATPIQLASGKSAFDYQCTDMSTQLTLGTFCHENGHMLCDYPDLYDYGSQSGGAGAFCLMCAGGNINEKNPTHISAYLKRLSGWSNSLTQIQHNQVVTLPAGQNDFAVFAKDSGEYFIIENRVKNGRDQSLPDQGLAIWHVDEDGDNSDEQMTPTQHYELSLEQADGQFRLENVKHYGDATDLYGDAVKRFSDSTTPNSKWWDGTASKLEIFEIGSPGASVRFKAKLFQDNTSDIILVDSTPNANIPDNNPIGITDTISINDDKIIAGVKVTLNIIHSYQGDLQVNLLTPWGGTIVLHQRQGGGTDNIQKTIDESDLHQLATLHGNSTIGVWTIQIKDMAARDTGSLNRWALEFMTESQPSGPITLEDTPGAHIPDNNPAGITHSLSTTADGTIDNIEVSLDIRHTWIADLKISVTSPMGTEAILHDRTGGSADNILKTFTATTSPGLATLKGENIAGDWQLHISDHAGRDTGKLNTWRLVIHPESGIIS